MSSLPTFSLGANCPHCREDLTFSIDIDNFLTGCAERLAFSIEARFDQLAESTSRRRSQSELKAIQRKASELERQLAEVQNELQNAASTNAELDRRLKETMADMTARRTDVGTALHTTHRSLSQRVLALHTPLSTSARLSGEHYGVSAADYRGRSEVAARIFRTLFTPHRSPETDQDVLNTLRSENATVRQMCETAEAIAFSIKSAGGYHCWLWDVAPRHSPFHAAFHEPWRNSPRNGLIDFVVIPAYMVDGSIIAKPYVYVDDGEQHLDAKR